MAEVDMKRVWRGWFRARFPGGVAGGFKGKRLEEALAMAETFRRIAGQVPSADLQNSEQPFSNALPEGGGGAEATQLGGAGKTIEEEG